MANHVFDRGELHKPSGSVRNADVVRYRVKRMPKANGQKKRRVACAEVVEREVVPMGRFVDRVATNFPNLQPAMINFVMEAVAETLAEELRQGHRVTIPGLFSLGVSLKGTVNPDKPLDAKKLTLFPWARFSQNFITTVNRGAKLAPLDPSPLGPDLEA